MWSVILLGVIVVGNMWPAALQKKKSLPVVTSASVPMYPRTPRIAHIDGVVRLRLSTDGARVSSMDVESGPPMLAQAAQENVRTWLFEKHSPTTFDVTFHYTLLPTKCDSECNCDDLGNGTAILRLPTEIEVSANEVMTCDPAKELIR
jgi:hypothetical protein